jgi:protein-disulfide isomerase
MAKLNIGAGAIAIGLLIAGCGSPQDFEQISEQQKQILEKLTKLEEGQKQLLTARPAARQRPQEDFSQVHEIDVGSSPIRGNPNASVTIVEFSDFQCPFCARTQPLLKQVLEKYPDRVRIVYKHFPLNFHKQARPAAIASLAAQEQGRFWELHDVLFDAGRALAEGKWDEWAEKAGLDVEKFKKDMSEKREEYDKRVSAEYSQGVKAQVRGTPTIYINGKKVRTRSIEGMSEMIEEVLKKGT